MTVPDFRGAAVSPKPLIPTYTTCICDDVSCKKLMTELGDFFLLNEFGDF